MKYLEEFFTSIAWWTLQPDDNLLAEQPGGDDPARHAGERLVPILSSDTEALREIIACFAHKRVFGYGGVFDEPSRLNSRRRDRWRRSRSPPDPNGYGSASPRGAPSMRRSPRRC
jgi:hypothetical protein